jgi:hypothetical protein
MIVEFVGSFTQKKMCVTKYQTPLTTQLEPWQQQIYLIVQMCVWITFSVTNKLKNKATLSSLVIAIKSFWSQVILCHLEYEYFYR